MNNIWITANVTLTNPLCFEDDNKNIVIYGRLTSNCDICFKVNNFVVFGEIVTTANITIKTKQDLFNAGLISAGKTKELEGKECYNSINDFAIEKIKALDIDLTRASDGRLDVRLPNFAQR